MFVEALTDQFGFQYLVTLEKIMNLLLELRPGEGGEDARLLVHNMGSLYLQLAQRSGCAFDLVDQSHG